MTLYRSEHVGQVFPKSGTECLVPECDQPVFIHKRQLCKFHYHAAYRAGKFGGERVERLWHRISEVAGEVATCSTCGPGSVVVPRRGRSACLAGERANSLKSRHGMTVAEVRARLDAVDWRCGICADDLRDQRRAIDHDHTCCPGAQSCGLCVRGILCTRCNVGIGMLKDDVDIVRAAVAYLEKAAS